MKAALWTIHGVLLVLQLILKLVPVLEDYASPTLATVPLSLRSLRGSKTSTLRVNQNYQCAVLMPGCPQNHVLVPFDFGLLQLSGNISNIHVFFIHYLWVNVSSGTSSPGLSWTKSIEP